MNWHKFLIYNIFAHVNHYTPKIYAGFIKDWVNVDFLVINKITVSKILIVTEVTVITIFQRIDLPNSDVVFNSFVPMAEYDNKG